MAEAITGGREKWKVTLAEAKAAPIPEGARSALLMRHGTMLLRWYAPKGKDPQTPHEQDELYIVAAGTGTFVNGSDRTRFSAGDVLFAAAGQTHRFEEFSDDFSVWVVFYG